MFELLEILSSSSDFLLFAAAEVGDAATAAGEAAEEPIEPFFSIQGLFTLGMLIVLQAVLGFDNLLYISIESKRAPQDQQSMVRKWGIGLAIGFRIGLLILLIQLVDRLKGAFFTVESDIISMQLSGHSLIVLGGGAFILWTAVKEIFHLLAIHDIEATPGKQSKTSVTRVIAMIVVMNLVFSFDSILSAMALTKNNAIIATAIVFSGLMMMWAADHVAEFLKKNRMYEVLGLFILFIVGIMLVSEGGHLAHLYLFKNEVMPMTKSTFYFVLAVLIVVDVVQTRYQKKLLAKQAQLEGQPA